MISLTYRIAPAWKEELHGEIKQLIDQGILEPSHRPWSASMVPIQARSQGGVRPNPPLGGGGGGRGGKEKKIIIIIVIFLFTSTHVHSQGPPTFSLKCMRLSGALRDRLLL